MTKVEFSPAGFKDLETQLYELSDIDLQSEADAVLVNYIDWVDNHVQLSTAQITYLQSLDAYFIASLAVKAAITFVNRLPLNLVLPTNYSEAEQEEESGKWFLDKSTIVASATPGEPVTATGELIYEFKLEE